MTRYELSQRINKVMNELEDHANGIKRLSQNRAQELVSELDEITEKLYCDGLEG